MGVQIVHNKEKRGGHRPRTLTGEDETRLIALVCGPAPEGRARWTMRLLADTWVTLEYTDAKTVPRERDETRPLVCMDECSKQLIGEIRTPLPVKPGQPACFDTEYVRNGTRDIFMFVAPLEGWRRAGITEQRTRKDWAERVKRLKDKLEIHYTPKHGNRLNMAEIELNVINNRGLSPRIPAIEQMRKEARAWNRRRNEEAYKINRRFTTAGITHPSSRPVSGEKGQGLLESRY